MSLTSYFNEFWNMVDWISFVILLTYFFGFAEDQSGPVNKLLSTFALVFTYYRSFSYLRIINSFTTLVGMINTIIIKMRYFFLILIYFYVTNAFLMIKLFEGKSARYIFEKTYVLTLFGGLSSEDFNEYPFAAVSIIFGTVIITIVLLNILIAYLSNLFSRLEDCQLINDYKEKAGMALDLEVMIHLFKRKFKKKKRKWKQNKIIWQLDPDADQEEEKDKEKEEILYIFKPIDYKDMIEEDQLDDNIYKKLKLLIKDINKIRTSLQKRDDKITKNVNSFISLLKVHSEVMKKIKSSTKTVKKSFLSY